MSYSKQNNWIVWTYRIKYNRKQRCYDFKLSNWRKSIKVRINIKILSNINISSHSIISVESLDSLELRSSGYSSESYEIISHDNENS